MAGLNTDIEHNGLLFHVQTQDMGSGANYVETTIYKSGRVLTARRLSYTSYLGRSDLKENIQKLIDKQHTAILQEIKAGKFNHL